MTAFLDSSAIVKLYVDEEGHGAVRDLEPPLMISALARVEVPAAMWRKHRIGELSAEDAALLTDAVASDVHGHGSSAEDGPRFMVVGLDEPVLVEAARLVAVHPLRAYDAVQLASALEAQRSIGQRLAFAAFDRSLNAAAAAEGLSPAV